MQTPDKTALQPEKHTLRVFWQKLGSAKYISHLDTQRAVGRALVRSGLPLGYSQGFNPHIKLVFALPISIYQECLYDIFDFNLETEVSPKDAEAALRAVMPPSMPVLRAARPVKKLKELACAGYQIDMETTMSAEEVKAAFSGEVRVEKKTKKSRENRDVSDMIRSLSVTGGDGALSLSAVLDASPDRYLNPKYLVDFLGDKVKNARITRLSLLTSNGELLV